MRKISLYWVFQLSGWTAYFLVYTFFNVTLSAKSQPTFFQILLVDTLIGILVTHAMRTVLKRSNLFLQPLPKQLLHLSVATTIFSFIYGLLSVIAFTWLQLNVKGLREYSFLNNSVRMAFGASLFLAIWNFIYFTYHYIQTNRKEQLKALQLQALVQEMELNTIKAHINPHFIFNALNSIRALVDENPQRARTAITELSNILRSSMQSEKQTKVKFEQELNIIKDYLALEHIRFEDRLKIVFEIEEETLDNPVPPMMLQTLVENAIKHGISKQLTGGTVKVVSFFSDDSHVMEVINSGHLPDNPNGDGFGVTGTINRLKLLYGKKASFSLFNLPNEQQVCARLEIPVQILV